MKATVNYLGENTGSVKLTDADPITGSDNGESWSLVVSTRPTGIVGKPSITVVHRNAAGDELGRRNINL